MFTRRLILITIALAIICAGCATPEPTPTRAPGPQLTPTLKATEAPTSTPWATGTPSPTDTPAPTNTPRPTHTPTQTSTPTPIADELAEDILSTYRALLIVQLNAELLHETATRVQSGELGGLDQLAPMIALGALIQAIEEAVPQITAPQQLADSWDSAVAVHERTKGVMRRWVNEEILSPEVVAEMDSVLVDIGTIASSTDDVLASEFGYDADLLAKWRQEVLEAVPELFEPGAEEVTPVPGLEVRAGYEYISYDYYHIVGEVINETDQWFESVKVVATLYDAEGNPIGADYTYTHLDHLPPHDVGVFTLATDAGGKAASVTSYQLQVEGMPSSGPEYEDFTVTVGNEYSEYDYYHLVGEVKNTGLLDCESVQIVAAFYDADGNLVGADYTYTTLDTVPAGGSSPFDLAAGNLAGPYDHFKAWVQGRPAE